MRSAGTGVFACGLMVLALTAGTARAESTHLVLPGESLWGIAAANNLTTCTVAAPVWPVASELAPSATVGTWIVVPAIRPASSEMPL